MSSDACILPKNCFTYQIVWFFNVFSPEILDLIYHEQQKMTWHMSFCLQLPWSFAGVLHRKNWALAKYCHIFQFFSIQGSPLYDQPVCTITSLFQPSFWEEGELVWSFSYLVPREFVPTYMAYCNFKTNFVSRDNGRSRRWLGCVQVVKTGTVRDFWTLTKTEIRAPGVVR